MMRKARHQAMCSAIWSVRSRFRPSLRSCRDRNRNVRIRSNVTAEIPSCSRSGQGLAHAQPSARTWLKGDDAARINSQLRDPQPKIRRCGISATATENLHVTVGNRGKDRQIGHTLSLLPARGWDGGVHDANLGPGDPQHRGLFHVARLSNARSLEVFDRQRAKLVRVAHPSLGCVDDPPGDDHRNGVGAINGAQGAQCMFVSGREPFAVFRTERRGPQHSINRRSSPRAELRRDGANLSQSKIDRPAPGPQAARAGA